MAGDDARFAEALGARGADVVRTQRLDHARAGQPRDDGDLRQGQNGDRQDHVRRRAIVPAGDRQNPKGRSEQPLQQRPGHETGYGHADDGDADGEPVNRPILSQGRDHAQKAAGQRCDNDRREAEPETDRIVLAQDVDHPFVVIFQRRAKIAACDAGQILLILDAQRLVQTEFGLNVLADFRRQAPVGVEGAAGRRAHHEKRHRDHHPEGNDSPDQSAQKETGHRSLFGRGGPFAPFHASANTG